jgi:uncharacterized protein
MEAMRLRLRVSPGAAQPRIVGRHAGAWKVRVVAPPERGRANADVVTLLARTLSLPRSAVTVVSGHGAPDKIVEVAGVGDAREIERRLAAAAGEELGA